MSMFFTSRSPRKSGRNPAGRIPGANRVPAPVGRTDPTRTLQTDGHRVSTTATPYPRRRRNKRPHGYHGAEMATPRMFRVT